MSNDIVFSCEYMSNKSHSEGPQTVSGTVLGLGGFWYGHESQYSVGFPYVSDALVLP